MALTDDQILDRLATARFGDHYTDARRDSPLWRTLRENAAWALPEVKEIAAEAYREGQDAGFEDCLKDAEDHSPNPYQEEA